MLKVVDATFAYPLRPLFEKLSFSVSAGELVHVRGANGAGKSTLLQMLAGLIRTHAGEIICDEAVDRRRVCEYLPADGSGLFGKWSAENNLSFWQQLRGAPAERGAILAELKAWQLASAHALHLPVERFSTGMRRRLALARLALSRCQYWLLDEPFNGLDSQGIELFVAALRKHIQDGGSAVLVAHEASYFQACKPKVLELGQN